MNDIEKAIELLKVIKQTMKVDHMTKDMWDGATEEETREYIEDFGLINVAISALEKQIPRKPLEQRYVNYEIENELIGYCSACKIRWNVTYWQEYCGNCGQKLDWSVEE